MSNNTCTITEDGSSNEELALRIQVGDRNAAELLLSQNEKYIMKLASKHGNRRDLEDLTQEGFLALLEAANQFDPSRGIKLLTYATPIIKSSMMDYYSQASLTISIPPSRYHQLLKADYICTEAKYGDTSSSIVRIICEELKVSQKVAIQLMVESPMLFNAWGDIFSIGHGKNPANSYNRYMQQVLILRFIEDVLKPRELNLVRYYLGIDQTDEQGMTFQELAIRLNYNSPSGAEKAYKSALRKLKKELPSSAYGQWIAIQKSINRVIAESGAIPEYSTPQVTWLDKQ